MRSIEDTSFVLCVECYDSRVRVRVRNIEDTSFVLCVECYDIVHLITVIGIVIR